MSLRKKQKQKKPFESSQQRPAGEEMEGGKKKQAFTKNMSFILLALKLYYHMSGQ